jgi:alpha/beta superfamily hydrolase
MISGAGNSKGSTSWTGKPEVSDYVSVAGFLIQYMLLLQNSKTTERNPSIIQLVLGGYSYGSLIASRVPDTHSIIALFASRLPSTYASEIIVKAKELARSTKNKLHPSKSSSEPPDDKSASLLSSEVIGSAWPSETSIDVSYLLVSPLLPPISTLISLPFGKWSSDQDYMQKFKEKPTLAIWGSADVFTSSNKLQNWAKDFSKVNSNFLWIEVQGASHFWRGKGVVQHLTTKIREFILFTTERPPHRD